MTIIFDRAHGVDVAGKRSPDSRLIEWEWSQLFISLVMSRLSNYDIFDLCPFIHYEKEPGLSQRVMTYNSLADKYGESLVISPHVNASSNSGWGTAHGFEIFTSRGQTKSDIYADIFGKELKSTFPDIRLRVDTTDGDLDKEANFTILYGYKINGKLVPAKYNAVLIENLFMDNKKEVGLLKDEYFMERLVDAYTVAILKINNDGSTDN